MCEDVVVAETPLQLNEKQTAVLRWIKEGCPEGTYPNGYEHRIIARTLERRGLVTIAGRGPTWTATLTEAGRTWNTHPPMTPPPAENEADLLIERVMQSNGHLELPKDRDVEKAYEKLVSSSLTSPKRPHGKKLVMVQTGHWSSGPKAIEFTEHFDDYVEPKPVPIPEHIANYHPAVKAFLENHDWQYVTKDHLPRAARILQALANEADRRGLLALTPKGGAEGLEKWEAEKVLKGQLAIQTPAGTYGLQIREISGPGAKKVEPRRWNEKKTQPAWIEHRGYEFISVGRLELIVLGRGTRHGGDRYRDAKSIKLEDKLPEVFRSFEIHKLENDWHKQKQQREEAERRSQWEAAMAEARNRYREQASWEHFKERSQEWQRVQHYRDFLRVVQSAAEDYDGERREELLSHLASARATLDSRDPLLHPELLLPDVPEPKPDDLKPFLDGWSPNEPVRIDWWRGLPGYS